MWSAPPHHVLLQLAPVQLECETPRMTTRMRPCSPQDEWRDLKWEFLTGLARPSHTRLLEERHSCSIDRGMLTGVQISAVAACPLPISLKQHSLATAPMKQPCGRLYCASRTTSLWSKRTKKPSLSLPSVRRDPSQTSFSDTTKFRICTKA
jgi:hypothetical protein